MLYVHRMQAGERSWQLVTHCLPNANNKAQPLNTLMILCDGCYSSVCAVSGLACNATLRQLIRLNPGNGLVNCQVCTIQQPSCTLACAACRWAELS